VGGSSAFVKPDAADGKALGGIVSTFQPYGWHVQFVLSVRSAAEAQQLVSVGHGSFASTMAAFLTPGHGHAQLDGFQLDMRTLAYDAALATPLTSFLLGLAGDLSVPLSVVVNGAAGDGSDVPVNLKTLGNGPVTVVTTGTFTPSVPELARIVNATSDALGGVSASHSVYAPGFSISDEYDQFKPYMYLNWGKINAFTARQVSKVCMWCVCVRVCACVCVCVRVRACG
jgi:hypothetical protein